MTRAAVYARVSTKEQSTEAQVGQLTAYCHARAGVYKIGSRDYRFSDGESPAPGVLPTVFSALRAQA